MGFFDFSIHFLCSIFSLARNLCKSIERAKWTKVNESIWSKWYERLFTLIESVFRCVMRQWQRLHEKIWMNRMQIDNIYHILRAWNTSIEFNFLLEFKFFGTTKLRLHSKIVEFLSFVSFVLNRLVSFNSFHVWRFVAWHKNHRIEWEKENERTSWICSILPIWKSISRMIK